MINKIFKSLPLLFFLVSSFNLCLADEFDFSGQVSGWTVAGENAQAGLRYIPQADWEHSFSGKNKLDAELSLNLYGFTPYEPKEDFRADAKAKLYRTWIRSYGDHYEARLGLQRISFGPARLLRTLMWFDNVDPRDPLKLTDGVYALLGKYCFRNNANVWLWGLYGNKEKMGWDVFNTDKNKPEFGGRFQFPVPRGELAFSYDNRHIDKDAWRKMLTEPITSGLENRYAIDGSFDISIGAWFEANLNEIRISPDNSAWEKYLTLGADYTFNIGPGIHALCEHFIKSTDAEIREADKNITLSALSVDFNIGILDTITATAFYNWKNPGVYPNISWQRTYNNWLINLTFFMNPETEGTFGEYYSGTGGMCIVAYNY